MLREGLGISDGIYVFAQKVEIIRNNFCFVIHIKTSLIINLSIFDTCRCDVAYILKFMSFSSTILPCWLVDYRSHITIMFIFRETYAQRRLEFPEIVLDIVCCSFMNSFSNPIFNNFFKIINISFLAIITMFESLPPFMTTTLMLIIFNQYIKKNLAANFETF